MQDFTLDLKPSRIALIYFTILYSLTLIMILTAMIKSLLNPFLTFFCISLIFYIAYKNIQNHALRKHKKSIIQLRFQYGKQELILKNNLGETIIKNNFAFNLYNSLGVLLDLKEKSLRKKPILILNDACDMDSFRRLHIFIQEHKKTIGEASEKKSKRRRAIDTGSKTGESSSL